RLVVIARYTPGPAARADTGRDKAKGVRALTIDAPGCGAPGGGGSPGGGGTAPGGGGTTTPPTDPENFNVIPPASPYTGAPINAANADRCDFLDAAVCLQPWPNDYFTVEDTSADTGRRINLNLLSMPRNAPVGLGIPLKPIDPTDHNRADGFSPGNLIVTKVPGLETQPAFEQNGLVSIDHPERYDDPDQKVVVINADTGERHPVWAEIDSNPPDPADVNLIIRPLENFDEGGRYVVALRNLVDEGGDPLQPADAFRAYRDNLTTSIAPLEDRRPHMEELFEILGDSQIRRSELYLAWDFTVASEQSLAGRMLKIRDEAFAGLPGGGDTNLADGLVQGGPPQYTLDAPTDFTVAEDSRIAREVTGTMTVPCFLVPSCAPAGGSFNNATSPDGVPAQNGTTTFTFTCRIPRATLNGPIATGVRPSLYGHGLLGSGTEVRGGNISAMAFEQQMMMCATDWYGFATQNIANIVAILQDLSLFPLLVDGSQQGFLHFLFLGRAMIHDEGFTADAAFQDGGGDSVIDTSALYYDGNSQGGILGGSLVAVAPDLQRGVLGVPGMNYSTLLRRSVDFEPYAEGQFGDTVGGEIEDAICDQAADIPQAALSAFVVGLCVAGVGTLPNDTPLGLYDNYPDELERPLILSLIQMLWDRGEANGYAHHMTSDPLPNTPPHEVLLHAAFGDHQVANVTAEVEARTIGASIYQPALDPGRHWEADGSTEIFGIPAIGSFPFNGSALVYWDGGPLGYDDPVDADMDPDGTATPPNGNVPPRPEDGYGADPHSYPRDDVKARAQKGAFLSPAGTVRNPCTTTNNVIAPPMPIAFETGAPIPCYANNWFGPP
ncbi:MAG: hypothetical protein H0V15_02685, partial [Solirubrobacterales bacterium]|nr:hypothetical protein [Solirubrobacterales bacterium]